MIVLLLCLAHLIVEFWLQTDSLPRRKIKQMKWHMFYLLLINTLALLIIWGYFYHFIKPLNYFLLPLLLLVVMHFIIDLCISKLLIISKSNGNKLVLFLFNQILHFATILIICSLFFGMTPTAIVDYVKQAFHNGNGINNFDILPITLLILIIFIIATSVSGQVIKLLVGSLPSDFANFEGDFTLNHKIETNSSNITSRESHYTEQYHYLTYSHPAPSRGKMIGYIERLLVILLTMAGAYSAIAFIIAAKSIARFKQLDDRNWAEYFLLGTLTSILLGVLIGLFAKQILL